MSVLGEEKIVIMINGIFYFDECTSEVPFWGCDSNSQFIRYNIASLKLNFFSWFLFTSFFLFLDTRFMVQEILFIIAFGFYLFYF